MMPLIISWDFSGSEQARAPQPHWTFFPVADAFDQGLGHVLDGALVLELEAGLDEQFPVLVDGTERALDGAVLARDAAILR